MDGQQKPEEGTEPTWQFNPGEVVSPRSAVPPQPVSPPRGPEASAVNTSIAPESQQNVSSVAPMAERNVEGPSSAPVDPQFGTAYPPSGSEIDDTDALSWTASEFVSHDKGGAWHAVVIVGGIIASALAWLLTRDIVSAAIIIIAAIMLSVYGARKPRQLQYQVNHDGITIGHKYYAFTQFRSFSVIPEGAFESILFVPLKRLAPPLSIYFDPRDGEAIIELISRYLPHQERRPDAVDRLMSKIRF